MLALADLRYSGRMSTTATNNETETGLDTQQVEVLGRNILKAALIQNGIEVATPERDNGIDLIAFRWSVSGQFVARPVQMKAASDYSFGIDRKYARIPGLILAYVMAVQGERQMIYAMTYPESLKIADDLGWTNTPSWTDKDAYSTRHESKRLRAVLADFEMRRGSWGRFFDLNGF